MRSFRSISSHLSRIYRTSSGQNPAFISRTTQNPNLIATVQSKFVSNFTSSAQESKPAPTEKVSAIVDEISGLTLLEVADLVEVLRTKLDMKDMPMMAVMMPGTQFGGVGAGTVRGSAGPAKGEEAKAKAKAAKTAFDLKLDGYDAAAKIKVIKEVRAFTDLGLKEAKDLVEKAPTLLKKGVTKEEADKIVQKMKEIGAKVSVE